MRKAALPCASPVTPPGAAATPGSRRAAGVHPEAFIQDTMSHTSIETSRATSRPQASTPACPAADAPAAPPSSPPAPAGSAVAGSGEARLAGDGPEAGEGVPEDPGVTVAGRGGESMPAHACVRHHSFVRKIVH